MKTFLITTIISLIAINVSAQTIIHVPGNHSTIQAAINASVNGDTILVQPGYYFERINFLGKSIIVTSTFIFNNDTSSISNTIIDANYLPNVVTFNHNEGNGSKLIGFTIQHGYFSGYSDVNGAGILIDGADPEVRNCVIKDNYISWYGGGICVKNGAEPLLSSLTIHNNIAQFHGGGIAILEARPKLYNLLLYNNTAGEWGGAIYVSSFPPSEIFNCTIVNNTAIYGGGGGIAMGNIIVMNSIFWGNVPDQLSWQSMPVFYSNIQGGYSGIGNINEYPNFVDATSHNYRLSDYSSSIGTGMDSLFYSGIWYCAPNTDLELNPRPNPPGSMPDIGAYENQLSHLRLLSPSLNSVANGSINQPLQPLLKWYSVSAATYYRLQLSLDSTFQSIIIDQPNLSDTTYLVSSLEYLTTYYWRVNASSPNDTSEWSDIWNFTTIIQDPEVPVLQQPANFSINLPLTNLFVWHNSLRAENYTIQISIDSLFTNILFQDSLITDTSITFSEFSNNQKYYWRVRAKNIGGYSSFSSIWNFKTKLQTPILLSPANNSQNNSINPTLSWSAVPGASNYQLQVALDPSFNQIVINDPQLTTQSIQIGPLGYNTIYYWRLRAYDSAYSSDFSNYFNFTTIDENPIPLYVLHYDSENNGGIGWGSDPFEASACFTASLTSPWTGGLLKYVRVFFPYLPVAVTMKIYAQGIGTPGALLLSQNLPGPFTIGWNEITLSTPITITGEDLWVGYLITGTPTTYPAGMDAGPANPNGDWIKGWTGGWQHLASFGYNANWNIRAVIEYDSEIIVTAPNGGETWGIGSTKTITWTSSNVSNVNIDYTTNNGNNWINIIMSTSSDGSYDWTIPNTISTQCKVKISNSSNAAIFDHSDNNFTISTITTFQLSVNVNDGWNMVSVPGVNPLGQGVEFWWPGRIGQVFRYNNGYQIVTITTPGIGYWMKNNGVQTYNTGDEWPAGGIQIVAHDPIAGASGWNLFGGYELSVTAANVTTVPGGLQSGPIFAYSNGYYIATTINPGYAYWIKLTAAGQIIIPETMAKGSATEYFPENWGRIIISDATGTNYTLYSVKGEVDLSQYELPPAPPAGMFDIRYESGRIAEDINSSIKAIDMSGVTYPLTVRVEGMDIRLMDESGKMLNTNLKSGEDVVISDATIQKLMVSGELLPTVYSLEQNYPNPFNPSTVIEFSLPEDVANVKLSIYNALGEKVAELVNTSLTAGKYQYQWNAQNVATGMYVYELRTDKFVSVKKMILMK